MGVLFCFAIMSFDLNVLDLNGNYVVDPRSESLEEVMKLQGIGWATRKIGAKFANSMGLNLVYYADKFVQTYSAAVKTKIVHVDMNANEKEQHDAVMNCKTFITVTFEDEGKTLKIVTKAPKKFERTVTWERIDDRTIHSTIDFALTDGSNQRVKVNRYYTAAPAQ